MSSTYSAGSADSALGLNEPACAPSPSAKSSLIANRSCAAAGPASPSTQTFASSQQSDWLSTESTSTPSVGGSHAKTSAMLVLALELTENDPGSGLSTRDLLANFDPESRLWRTSQRCLTGEWEPYSETFPESGMTRNGQLFPHAPWALHMCDDDCSLWPTPTASMDGRGFGIPLHTNTDRYKASTVRRVHALVGAHGWRIHPNFTEVLMGFPLEASAIEPLVTPSSRQSPKRSDGQ
jgi:hypothetical protein